MKYQFSRWKALIPTLLPLLSLALFAVSGDLWAGVGFFLGIALSTVLGALWCSCPGCGAAMLVRGGMNPFASKPFVCPRCGAEICLN